MRIISLTGLISCALVLTACYIGPIDPPLRFEPELRQATPSPALPTIPPSPTPLLNEVPVSPDPTLILPTSTPYPDAIRFSLGESWEGRTIWAWRFGEGPDTIVLIGGIHGGYEANTVILAEQLVNHFRLNPNDILPGIRLVIIPAANPDGLTRGDNIEGRFNARGVDLNRNWGCNWSPTAYLGNEQVDPGPRPFSEPETVALRAYFVAEPPDAVIFYHSALGAIFTGACGGNAPAGWLGALLEEATGYTHEAAFTHYQVTGDATDWLAERGIPAVVVELETRDDPEFRRNLAGVIALECHFVLDELPHNEATAQLFPDIHRLCVSK